MEYADELPDDQPLSEEEVEYAMQQALALNQYLKQMQLEAEQQPQRPPGRGPPPRRGAPASSSSRGMASMMQAPNRGQTPGAGGWGGTTHTQGRAKQIDHANAILVDKLTRIAGSKGPTFREKPAAAKPKGPGSAAINRRKQDEKIARENEALARRLAGAKPAVSANRKPPPNRPMQRPRSFNGASPMGASLRNQRGPPPPRAMHDSGRMQVPMEAHFPPGPVHEPAPGSGMDYLLDAAEAAARG